MASVKGGRGSISKMCEEGVTCRRSGRKLQSFVNQLILSHSNEFYVWKDDNLRSKCHLWFEIYGRFDKRRRAFSFFS